jgi:hypothetical protein
MRFGAFVRGVLSAARADPKPAERVRAWARATLPARDDTTFAVNEIVCTDPGCPGSETVILVMAPGRRTRACKIPKLMNDVTEQDVRRALGLEEIPPCPASSEPPPSALA